MNDTSRMALLRHAWRLTWRRRGTMLFFACCLSLGIGFLSAVSHLLLAVDQAIATRARELLAGDLQVVSNRPFTPSEKKTLSRVVTGDRQATLSVSLASMLTPASSAPFLVSVKALEPAYPLHGKMQTQPSGATIEPGYCFLERTAAIAHHLKIGDTIRLGRLELRIKAILDKEPDRDFFGFTFAPRVMIALNDLSRAGLLGFGARVRYSWTMALADRENPDTAVRAVKKILEKSLPDPHLSVTAYMDGEASIRDGLRRSGLFFTLLSLSALLLGAAGLRAGVALFLNRESESIGLLRCLGLTRADIEKLYGGLCLSFGLLGGAMGAAGGWLIAAFLAKIAGQLLELSLMVTPQLTVFAECLVLSSVLSWSLTAAKLRALALHSPLDAQRSVPSAPRRFVLLGWTVAALTVFIAAWRRSPSTEDAAKMMAALAVGTLIVEILSRTALAAAEQLTRRMASVGIPFAFRHGLRRLTRRGLESRVMLFTLAGGLALLISVGTTREGFSRVLSISQSTEAPDLFLMDVQPEQVKAAKALVAPYSRSAAIFAPLVRARLTHINGEALKRGDLRQDAGSGRDQKQARSREYNLTYADELNPSEKLIAGKEWPVHSQTAEASLEREFAKRAGLKMGSVLTFDVSGRDVTATVTSLRRVEWASMRPNFFVTLSPSLIASAPQTFIASFKSRDLAASAAVRRELAEKIPNISVIDAAALLGTVRHTLDLMLTAIETLAWFCVLVGVLVVAGLVALSRSQRSADNALERVLGFSRRDTLLADIAELLGLGALSVLCGLSAALFLAWSLSNRFDLPLVFNLREMIIMLIAALLLPTLSGLLAGSASRHTSALDAFRQEN